MKIQIFSGEQDEVKRECNEFLATLSSPSSAEFKFSTVHSDSFGMIFSIMVTYYPGAPLTYLQIKNEQD